MNTTECRLCRRIGIHLKEVKKNYHIKNEKMVDQMMKIGQKENVKFYYNPEEWIFFDDLLRELPILENYSKVEFIKKKKKTIIEYNDYIYYDKNYI